MYWPLIWRKKKNWGSDYCVRDALLTADWSNIGFEISYPAVEHKLL